MANLGSESETCVGSRVHLVGVSISIKMNFYRLPFTPLSGSPFRSFTCEASGAKEHGHDSKHEASSGRTNNAIKGVDESVWAVQLVEHVGKKVMEEK
jgi:hypothetical protein